MLRLGWSAGVLLLVLSLGSPARAQEEAEPAPPAPRAVVKEANHDFGVVIPGDQAAAEFEIENRGTLPLEIVDAAADCACTLTEYDETIAPGEVGRVSAVVDTTTLAGLHRKQVVLATNDPANRRLVFTMQADVRPLLSIYPGRARYNVIQGFEEEGTILQNLWATDGAPFEVVEVESPYSYVAVRFRKASELEHYAEGGAQQWIIETVLSPDAPIGALAEHVMIRTSHPRQTVIPLALTGFVRPMFSVTPQVADFGQLQIGDQPIRARILVKNFDADEHQVTAVDEELEGLEASVLALEEGRQYYVELVLKPEMPKGSFKETVTIHTSARRKPRLELVVKGTVL